MEKQDNPLKTVYKGRKQGFWKRVYANKLLLLMLLPSVLYVVIFAYIPMGGVFLAFKNYNFAKGFLAVHGVVLPTSGFSSYQTSFGP